MQCIRRSLLIGLISIASIAGVLHVASPAHATELKTTVERPIQQPLSPPPPTPPPSTNGEPDGGAGKSAVNPLRPSLLRLSAGFGWTTWVTVSRFLGIGF